ncbi:MAG TPA: hypothetical protein VHC91_06800 [Trinickia sp.]|jgi:hypothetical protein|uniref:hypothetical protein n=1 Tax=Trinickia sp. TaxID=2571163 RepID=UPI002B687558|nr:hypothetical protein [Trinickia sp.]HVW50101.1 hypothetical protein [Trinickia sp.]
MIAAALVGNKQRLATARLVEMDLASASCNHLVHHVTVVVVTSGSDETTAIASPVAKDCGLGPIYGVSRINWPVWSKQ